MYMKNQFVGDKYVYSFLQTSWGMYVSFKASITSFQKYEEQSECLKITDGFWIRVMVSGDELWKNTCSQYIEKGLRMILGEIESRSKLNDDTLIIFHDFVLPTCLVFTGSF